MACVHAALDAGITTFDTADVYAQGAGRVRPRPRRSKGCGATRSRSSPRSYWPTGPTRTTAACHASTSWSRCTRRSSACRPTTSISSRPTGSTTRPRSRRRCRPSTTWCARARCTTSGCRSGRGPDRRGAPSGRRHGLRPHRVEPAAVLAASGGSSRPRWCRSARSRASARSCGHRSPRACSPGKYLPGAASAPPAGSRATAPEGGEMSWLLRDEVLEPVRPTPTCAGRPGTRPAAVGAGLGAAEREREQRHRRGQPARADRRERQGARRRARARLRRGHREDTRPGHPLRSRLHLQPGQRP